MIKIFKGDYDRNEFYSIMGKFFAEPFYKKELPYLTNRENTVWYLNIKNGEVVAFSNYEEHKKRVEFKTDYFLYSINDLEELIKNKLDDLKGREIETANSNKEIVQLFIKYGFEEYRKTTNYVFLRKEN